MSILIEEPDPGIVRVTLNRAEARNAITTGMGEELLALWTDLALRPGMRALILTGAGDVAFSAGGDLKERHRQGAAELARSQSVHRLAGTVRQTFAFPVIAALNGAALGGGAELALSADLVLMADHAVLGLPEIRHGFMPGMGGTQALMRRAGKLVAAEMLLTGEAIGAERALALGLANRVVPGRDLPGAALALARQIASAPEVAVQAIIRALRFGDEGGLTAGLALEAALHRHLMDRPERQAGVARFAEGRASDRPRG